MTYTILLKEHPIQRAAAHQRAFRTVPWELDSTPKLEKDVNRKKIKAGPGKQWVEGKDFRLAKEIKYIQRRAAEHGGRLSPSARWRSFRPKPGMPGYWTPQINLLHGSPAMGTQSTSTSKKATLTSLSAGKVTTALKVVHWCTQTKSRGASLRSLAIPAPKLHNS